MGGGQGRRAFQYVRGNYKPLKGTNVTIAARSTPFYHPPGNVYYCGRFDVTCSMQPS